MSWTSHLPEVVRIAGVGAFGRSLVQEEGLLHKEVVMLVLSRKVGEAIHIKTGDQVMSATLLDREASPSCGPSLVDRGPTFLLVTLRNVAARVSDQTRLADVLWGVLEQHLTYRLVLDLERADPLDEVVVEQLMALAQRIASRGGLMRLCSLSAYNRAVLERSRVTGYLPIYGDVGEAIFAERRPCVPRRAERTLPR